jgi:hypothetical protein
MKIVFALVDALRPNRPRTSFDDWMDFSFFAFISISIVIGLISGFFAWRRRRRAEGPHGALDRVRARQKTKSLK